MSEKELKIYFNKEAKVWVVECGNTVSIHPDKEIAIRGALETE